MKRLVAALVLVLACGKGDSGKPGAFRPLTIGDAAPRYAAMGMSGEFVSLDQLKGRAVLLNVWATWCVPCREEMPALQRTHEAFADSGLTVLGISVDAAGADEDITRFAKEHHIGFPLAKDPNRLVARIFRTIGVPETFLLDREGNIAGRWIGQFDPESAENKDLIRRALNG